MGTHITHRDLSNEYQLDRVQMVFKNLCVLVIWTKVALALDVLTQEQSDFKSYLQCPEQFASNSTTISGISLYIASGLSIASVEPRCQSIHSVIQQPGHHWQTLAVMTHCVSLITQVKNIPRSRMSIFAENNATQIFS